MLLFKKKFLPAIRSGEKTQTIRLWKFRHMRTGQRSYIPGIGHIRITLVEPVDIDALTDADAIPDGFPTAADCSTSFARSTATSWPKVTRRFASRSNANRKS